MNKAAALLSKGTTFLNKALSLLRKGTALLNKAVPFLRKVVSLLRKVSALLSKGEALLRKGEALFNKPIGKTAFRTRIFDFAGGFIASPEQEQRKLSIYLNQPEKIKSWIFTRPADYT